jgi:hypothetical protein
MASDTDLERGMRSGPPSARQSSQLYRGGGAVMGGVEPLFDYDREGPNPRDEELRMDRFSLRNDDEDDEDDDEDFGGHTPKPKPQHL